jgi:hypothetical protein
MLVRYAENLINPKPPSPAQQVIAKAVDVGSDILDASWLVNELLPEKGPTHESP